MKVYWEMFLFLIQEGEGCKESPVFHIWYWWKGILWIAEVEMDGLNTYSLFLFLVWVVDWIRLGICTGGFFSFFFLFGVSFFFGVGPTG